MILRNPGDIAAADPREILLEQLNQSSFRLLTQCVRVVLPGDPNPLLERNVPVVDLFIDMVNRHPERNAFDEIPEIVMLPSIVRQETRVKIETAFPGDADHVLPDDVRPPRENQPIDLKASQLAGQVGSCDASL